MKPYAELTTEELLILDQELRKQYRQMQNLELKLDMSRGKPSADQLDLSMGMMDALNSDADMRSDNGVDCRNYGCLEGIP